MSQAAVLFARCAVSKARKSQAKVKPAWVREVTGCSRGLPSKLAAALNEDSR